MATQTKPKTNKRRPVKKLTEQTHISEEEIAELTRLATEMNDRLDRIHEMMQDIVTDLRAARSNVAQ